MNVKALADGIAPVMVEAIEHYATKPLSARIAVLEKALANGPNLADAFRGSWQPGSVYVRGSLAVHDGSLWLSLADTEQRPGSDAAWRLVTKRGANGKDLR